MKFKRYALEHVPKLAMEIEKQRSEMALTETLD